MDPSDLEIKLIFMEKLYTSRNVIPSHNVDSDEFDRLLKEHAKAPVVILAKKFFNNTEDGSRLPIYLMVNGKFYKTIDTSIRELVPNILEGRWGRPLVTGKFLENNEQAMSKLLNRSVCVVIL
jgi:hypothetical protein